MVAVPPCSLKIDFGNRIPAEAAAFLNSNTKFVYTSVEPEVLVSSVWAFPPPIRWAKPQHYFWPTAPAAAWITPFFSFVHEAWRNAG
jgi:hypothetical protein